MGWCRSRDFLGGTVLERQDQGPSLPLGVTYPQSISQYMNAHSFRTLGSSKKLPWKITWEPEISNSPDAGHCDLGFILSSQWPEWFQLFKRKAFQFKFTDTCPFSFPVLPHLLQPGAVLCALWKVQARQGTHVFPILSTGPTCRVLLPTEALKLTNKQAFIPKVCGATGTLLKVRGRR